MAVTARTVDATEVNPEGAIRRRVPGGERRRRRRGAGIEAVAGEHARAGLPRRSRAGGRRNQQCGDERHQEDPTSSHPEKSAVRM